MCSLQVKRFLHCAMSLFTVLPVAASVSADETEALKAEITKAVEKVQEAGKATRTSDICVLNNVIPVENHVSNQLIESS